MVLYNLGREDAHLPTGAVDCLEASADLLHGLIACESAQGRHKRLAAHELPQLLCSHTGQGVLNDQRALKALDIILDRTEADELKGKTQRCRWAPRIGKPILLLTFVHSLCSNARQGVLKQKAALERARHHPAHPFAIDESINPPSLTVSQGPALAQRPY